MIISLGELNKKCWLFILVPIFLTIRWYMENYIFEDSKKNLFFGSFLRFFSNSLNIILWIIFNKSMSFEKNKDKEKEKERNSINDDNILKDEIKNIIFSEDRGNNIKRNSFISQFELEMIKEQEKKELMNKSKRVTKLGDFFLLLLSGFVDFIFTSISLIIDELRLKKRISVGISALSANTRLVICAIFSYYLIKSSKMYRHHYFSAIVIAIIVILFLISSFIIEPKKNKDFLFKFILKTIPDIGNTLSYTLGLMYLIKTSGNIYKYLFYIGLIGMIFSILFQIFFSFFKCKKYDVFDEYYNYCDGNNFKTILYNLGSFEKFNGIISISIILINFLENICLFSLIYYFSLNHYGAIYSIPTYFRIFDDKLSFGFKIYYFIAGIIIIFMSLVFNEIIILNFWGLNINTKKYIMQRAKSEYLIDQIEKEQIYEDDDDEDDF